MSVGSIGETVAALLAAGAAEGIGGEVAVAGLRRVAARAFPWLSKGQGEVDDAADRDGLAGGDADREALAAQAEAIDERLASDPEFRIALHGELKALEKRHFEERAPGFLTVVTGGKVGPIVNVREVRGDLKL
jgi:hypothetical protein